MNISSIAHHFDTKAAEYARFYGSRPPRHLYEYEKRIRLESALGWISDRMDSPRFRVLDVGCGSGEFLKRVLRQHGQSSAIGIDPSSGMIHVARALLTEEGLGDRVEFRVGELSPAGEECDVVVSLGVIGYQSDQCDFARLLAGKVRSGGILILSYANGDSILRQFRARLRGLWRDSITFEPIRSCSLNDCLVAEGLRHVLHRHVCCDVGIPAGPFSVAVSRRIERLVRDTDLARRICGVGIAMYEKAKNCECPAKERLATA